MLKLCEREGSTLSGDLRKAYDLKPLGNLTREHGDRTAEGYFLGAIGSITPAELRHLLDEVSIENGFANRWLLLHCEISHAMPRRRHHRRRGRQAARRVDHRHDRALDRGDYRITDDLAGLWDPFYVERRTGMLDESPLVRVFAHRQPATRPGWRSRSRRSTAATALRPADIAAGDRLVRLLARHRPVRVRRRRTGDAGKLLAAIRAEGTEGLDGTAQHDLFSRNLSGEQSPRCGPSSRGGG